MSEWNVFVEPAGEWIPVVVEEESQLPDVSAGLDDDLARQVDAFAKRAWETAAVAAGCLVDDTGFTVVAFLEVHSFPVGGEDGMPRDLDQLATLLRPGTETWSEVTRLDLPAGDAVQLRMIDAEPAPDGDKTVVESVSTAVRTPDGAWVAIALLTWTDLALSEQLQEISDDIAQTLRFETVDE